MAQRDAVDDTATEATVTEQTDQPTVTDVTEAPATDQPTEAPVVTEPVATEPVATEPEKPKIVTADEVAKFLTVIDADGGPIKTADATNGSVSEDGLKAATEAYAALPSPTVKKAALAALNDAMVTALSDRMDAITARSYSLVKKALADVVAPKVTAVKEPVDPSQAFVDAATALYLGNAFLVQPEGLATDWATKVQEAGAALAQTDVPTWLAYLDAVKTYQALSDEDKAAVTVSEDPDVADVLVNLEPVAPKVSPIVVRAATLARGGAVRAPKAAKASDGTKAPRQPKADGPAYDGPKRSITKHIAEYFGTVPVGTFAKIAEIRAYKSAEYPDGDASQGAISAAMFADGAPKDISAKLPGIVAEEQDGRKGARKVA